MTLSALGSGDKVWISQRLNLMVLELFSNLNNSGILLTLGAHSWDMEEQELEALIDPER